MSSQVIAGFEILEKIGEGGMGSVYRARQMALDRMVAFKILPPQLAEHPDDVERFKLEARAAAMLSHQGIVQVHEAGESEGIFYFAMELVDGRSVGQWLREDGKIPLQDALSIGQCVAEALAYAWEKAALVHRDIKPDNILIDEYGNVKVADLGLIKLADSQAGAGPVLCTPNFVSPEQAHDEDIDCRSDMYSLGATLYYMVTGILPFGEYDAESAIDMQIDGYLPDPRVHTPEISTGFAVVLRKLMAKEARFRYSDWHEAELDFKRLRAHKKPLKPLHPAANSTISTPDSSVAAAQADEGGAAPATSKASGARSRRQRSRRRKARKSPAGMIVLLLVFFAALGMAGMFMIQQANIRRQAILEQRLKQQERERDAHMLTTSPPPVGTPTVPHPTPSPNPEASAAAEEAEIRKVMRRLIRKANALSRSDIVAAIEVMESYDGPYAAETRAARRAAIDQLKTRANAPLIRYDD